ncbi:hypothetical protein PRK78_006717 [Emydomyces testavorans]|uniref:Uncharacterized protein n=1 Tax=Emydomyces testavorans TaxID=2070801 RepID=A0AAF0IM05_9EURO|nr:hypothetical protein PRK78_006717 [Emydomyces testavorans]
MATEVQSLCTTFTRVKAHSPAFIAGFFTQYSSMPTAKKKSPSPELPVAAAYPRPNLLKRIMDRLRLEYYRYEVTCGAYVMTPGEKFIFNSFIVIVLALLIWALFLYFPSLLYHKVSRLGWLLTGRGGTGPNVKLSPPNGSDTPVSLLKLPPFDA